MVEGCLQFSKCQVLCRPKVVDNEFEESSDRVAYEAQTTFDGNDDGDSPRLKEETFQHDDGLENRNGGTPNYAHTVETPKDTKNKPRGRKISPTHCNVATFSPKEKSTQANQSANNDRELNAKSPDKEDSSIINVSNVATESKNNVTEDTEVVEDNHTDDTSEVPKDQQGIDHANRIGDTHATHTRQITLKRVETGDLHAFDITAEEVLIDLNQAKKEIEEYISSEQVLRAQYCLVHLREEIERRIVLCSARMNKVDETQKDHLRHIVNGLNMFRTQMLDIPYLDFHNMKWDTLITTTEFFGRQDLANIQDDVMFRTTPLFPTVSLEAVHPHMRRSSFVRRLFSSRFVKHRRRRSSSRTMSFSSIRSAEDIGTVRHEFQSRAFHESLSRDSSDGRWIHERKSNLHVSYRIENDGAVTVKIRGKLKVKLLRVLAILYESDLGPRWQPFLKTANILAKPTRASMLVQQISDFGIGLGKRESIVYAFGVDSCDDKGSVIMLTASPPLEELDKVEGGTFYNMKLPAHQRGVKRGAVNHMLWVLMPLDSAKATSMEIYASVNPGINVRILQPLINWVVKKLVKGVFAHIATVSERFDDTIFAQRVENNPEFYGWINGRVEGVFKNPQQNNDFLHNRSSLKSFVVE